MENYNPLLMCDACERLTRHTNPEQREVPGMKWVARGLPPKPTQQTLIAIVWHCVECGADRRYGALDPVSAGVASRISSPATGQPEAGRDR